jgi:hypothetical protein
MTDLKHHSQCTSAARAGFSERTARRFDADPTPPSQRKIVHGRTVADPLEGYWENDILPLLENDNALQAVTLLRHLQGLHPLAFPDDRIRRTLQQSCQLLFVWGLPRPRCGFPIRFIRVMVCHLS